MFFKTWWTFAFKKQWPTEELARRFHSYHRFRSSAKAGLQATTNVNLLVTTDKLFYWYGQYNYQGKTTEWLANKRLLILCKLQWKKNTVLLLRRFPGRTNQRHDNRVSENRIDSWTYRIRIQMMRTRLTGFSSLTPKAMTHYTLQHFKTLNWIHRVWFFCMWFSERTD